jgi:glycosyltransferase involved in cell wall biosynthesis
MRWLLTSGDFTPLGGMDRANHALALCLAARGDDLQLVTHRAWHDLRQERVRTTVVRRPLGSHVLGAPLLASTARAAARRAGSGTRVLVNGGNADTDDVSWVHYLHAANRVQANNLNRGLRFAAVQRYFLARERRVLRSARYIVCNSRRTAADVLAAYDVSPERIRVVYYGSDPAQFSPVDQEARLAARHALGWPAGRRVALFVGALSDRRKGFDRLFEAWRVLTREPHWDVDLAVAGTGGELRRWRARATAEGMHSITFLGFRPDISVIMAASDVMVHPARYEAYGLGVHEAICRGLPAIVSASAGVAEHYGGDLAGLLIRNPESAADIADRIRSWRSAPAAVAASVAVLSDRFRRRTWDEMSIDFVKAVAA